MDLVKNLKIENNAPLLEINSPLFVFGKNQQQQINAPSPPGKGEQTPPKDGGKRGGKDDGLYVLVLTKGNGESLYAAINSIKGGAVQDIRLVDKLEGAALLEKDVCLRWGQTLAADPRSKGVKIRGLQMPIVRIQK